MITEDERWREQFSDERNGDRDGYRPYDRQSSKSFNNGETHGEGRQKRPRIQRSSSYDTARPQSGGYGQRREGGYHTYNREGGYQRERSYNREGGYQRREGEYGREGGYRPRREGGFGQRRDGNGFQREKSYSREGGFQRQGGYGQRPYRQRTADYNPHAKYSMKKQIEYKEKHYDPNEPIRLNKFLANSGVCSRREADDFIQAGVVRVNGQVVTELGTKVLRTDSVLFHDQLITPERKVYVLLNKPKDTVTTSDDPQNRKTVMDIVKDACRERIYPVGRLDRNTTGVLLLTNDGELASKLTHPQYKKKKIYHVYLDKNVLKAAVDAAFSQYLRDDSFLQTFLERLQKSGADGLTLEDGEIHVDAIEYANDTDKNQVGIEIHSGRNRIVRRIFEHLGYKVVKLDRVYFAGLTKKNVRRGDWRFLTEAEVNMLHTGMFE